MLIVEAVMNVLVLATELSGTTAVKVSTDKAVTTVVVGAGVTYVADSVVGCHIVCSMTNDFVPA